LSIPHQSLKSDTDNWASLLVSHTHGHETCPRITTLAQAQVQRIVTWTKTWRGFVMQQNANNELKSQNYHKQREFEFETWEVL